MTDWQRIEFIRGLLGNDGKNIAEETIAPYLEMAKATILNRRYEVAGEYPEGTDVPKQYQPLQCILAVRYITRRGAEGQTSHSENGTSRSWASADDADLLNKVTPLVGIPS